MPRAGEGRRGSVGGAGGGAERWAGRPAMVTGANSGIGAAVTRRLLALGLTVAALDRQVEQLQILALGRVGAGGAGRLRPLQCDLHSEQEALAAFDWAEKHLPGGGPQLLVCCAGVAGEGDVLDGSAGDWRRVLDVNVVAAALCARETVRRMRARGAALQEGLIINIGGASPPAGQPGWALHAASKAALRALTQSLREELRELQLPVRVALVSPGLTRTRLLLEAGGAAAHARAFGGSTPALQPNDVAAALDLILAQPSHVQVEEIVITPLPTEMANEQTLSIQDSDVEETPPPSPRIID